MMHGAEKTASRVPKTPTAHGGGYAGLDFLSLNLSQY